MTTRRTARIGAGIAGALVCLLIAGSARAAGQGTYEDPVGRFRFTFSGTWRVGADAEDPAAADHFYLVKGGEVAAELIVSSRLLPATQRFKDFVDAEIEALDAEPGMYRSSVKRNLRISGQPAARVVARMVDEATDERRETLVVQYWFARRGELWSLLMLTTPAAEQRWHVIDEVEKSVVAGFEVIEPDEVARAVTESKKTARLGDGLAEITLPEAWTLLKVEEDLIAAEFDKGRVYVFGVVEQAYGEALGEVAHGFLVDQAGLDTWEVRLESDVDVHGTAGRVVILEGDKDGRPYVVQLLVVMRGKDAFFLYGIAAKAAWAAARPWITAVQYTVRLLGPEAAGEQSGAGAGGSEAGSDGADAEDGASHGGDGEMN